MLLVVGTVLLDEVLDEPATALHLQAFDIACRRVFFRLIFIQCILFLPECVKSEADQLAAQSLAASTRRRFLHAFENHFIAIMPNTKIHLPYGKNQ